MDVKCPRCENRFEADEFIFKSKCQKCGLFIGVGVDEYFDGEDADYCWYSSDTPAACCKACENLNLESCVGICKMDSEK